MITCPKQNLTFPHWPHGSNVIEKVANFHYKNHKKKFVVNNKGITKKFNDKCFICNKIKTKPNITKISPTRQSLN